MKIGILGTGDVGQALGDGFVALGHEVMMGSRDTANEKAIAWAKESGPTASVGAFADAAGFGDIVVLATLGVANDWTEYRTRPNETWPSTVLRPAGWEYRELD